MQFKCKYSLIVKKPFYFKLFSLDGWLIVWVLMAYQLF